MTTPRTQLIHHRYEPPAGFSAPQPGVHKASTVFFSSVEALRSIRWKDRSAYTYGLHGTPTTYTLEERLCTLEGGRYCVLTPSGLSAITLVFLAMLRTGDEVLLPWNTYSPAVAFAQQELLRWGITHQFYDPLRPEDLAQRIRASTRLVWIEAAGSVTLEFPDLPALVRICLDAGVRCALDDTWSAGQAYAPFDLLPGTTPALGVDIALSALTKYHSGGGDILMGSLITVDADLHERLSLCHMRLGLGVGANDVEAVLRGLPTLAVRYAAQDEAARTLAVWCQSRPEFAQVLHPALPGSPGHAHWLALCHGNGSRAGRAAGLFAVVFRADIPQASVDAFCNALQYFRIGYSWGGPVSLVMPYDLPPERRQSSPHLASGCLVRFAIGFEDVADLQADLSRALGQCLQPR
ncbi:PLP-dependent transferase [Candidatus Symbiobacter mobilis]|uniref:Cystathionine beta-lyase n=1 Tax=Candidatus Symbiobacter mobilis CR TaxID=946483 RepID=U5N9I1_9BURK|nr:PLP-dependent transferase [Candidatus Symbiobacter mobilis]AGX88067.1 cystathionine beta-lyase [Candidatus Symbiobacter mobilis CR]